MIGLTQTHENHECILRSFNTTPIFPMFNISTR